LPIIETADLSKVYRVPVRDPGRLGAVKALFRPLHRNVPAVDRISLAIEPGEIIGYIGPNGAGKSTTIKLLCGILVPTSGTVKVNGLIPHRQRIANARGIGLVFGQRTQLLWDLPVRESFYLLRRIYEIPGDVYRASLAELREVLELQEIWDLPVRLLSLGQRMRGELAAALIHRPAVAYLDEPTIGLDVMAKARVRDFLRYVNSTRRTTIILATHDLRDVEEVCRRIIMIHKGRIIYDGGLDRLRERFGDRCTLVADLVSGGVGAGPGGVASRPGTLRERLGDEISLIKEETDRVELTFDRSRVSASEAIARLCAILPVRDLTLRETDLEAVVKQVYGAPGGGGYA
jgi:ABC-2 type transport system ATP-binding protein